MNSFLKLDSFLNKVGAFLKKFIYITITTFICFVTNSAFAKIYSKLIGFVEDNSVVKAQGETPFKTINFRTVL